MPSIVANVSIPTLCVHTPLDSRAKLNYQYRNRLINGDFEVWQRGVAFDVVASEYTADRWLASVVGDVTRQSFLPGESELMSNDRYYLRIAPSGIGTIHLQQRIVDVRTLAGKDATLTLWARGVAGELLTVTVEQYFGTGGTPSDTVVTAAGTLTLTTAWKLHTLNIEIPSVLDKAIGTNEDGYLALKLQYPLATVDVAHAQLEEGLLATDFEKMSYEATLDACRRYFEVVDAPAGIIVMAGQAVSDTSAYCRLGYLPKRAAPTVTMPTEIKLLDSDGVSIDTAWAQGVANTTESAIVGTVAAGLEAGDMSLAQADADAEILIDAEI